jgi:hypothetical protein
MKRRYLTSFLILTCCFVAGAQNQSNDRFAKVTERLVAAINAEEYEKVQQDFGKVMLDAFPIEKSKPFFEKLTSNYGKIKILGLPRITPPAEANFPAYFDNIVLDIKIVLDDNDKIIGLWFLSHREDIPVPERNSVKLGLPFEGKWMVFWGGRTKEQNQHIGVPNQQYAFDFLIADESGKTHKGEGKICDDYYAFGKKVLCPADGIVTDVIAGVRDNLPGSMNPYSALGNCIIIQHDTNMVSVIAHLKYGSIVLKQGDKVKKGQVLGLCGNSGNSSEPHIHFHLQNTPVIQDGTGIQCQFDKVNILVKGKSETKHDYSPVKGEIVGQE